MKVIWAAFLAVSSAATCGQEIDAQVMLLGVFHFANPGRDVVQVDQIDVSTPENQAYLEGLARRLCEFRPTVILVETTRDREEQLQHQLRDYLSNQLALGTNETYQIGFRVAKVCGVERLHGFDEDDVGWRGDLLFDYLQRAEPDLFEVLSAEIERAEEADSQAHSESDLRQLLIRTNDSELDRMNRDFYLLTNVAGAREGFEGADAAAGWWHRNLRMYANIQAQALAGERVLVIAGQGHTAILREFLETDRRIEAHDVQPYL